MSQRFHQPAQFVAFQSLGHLADVFNSRSQNLYLDAVLVQRHKQTLRLPIIRKLAQAFQGAENALHHRADIGRELRKTLGKGHHALIIAQVGFQGRHLAFHLAHRLKDGNKQSIVDLGIVHLQQILANRVLGSCGPFPGQSAIDLFRTECRHPSGSQVYFIDHVFRQQDSGKSRRLSGHLHGFLHHQAVFNSVHNGSQGAFSAYIIAVFDEACAHVGELVIAAFLDDVLFRRIQIHARPTHLFRRQVPVAQRRHVPRKNEVPNFELLCVLSRLIAKGIFNSST